MYDLFIFIFELNEYNNMKKYLLHVLIVIMTISLIGIVMVQLFWIQKAIEVKEAEYEENIREALDNIVKQEPNVALFGGQLGVDFYEKILKDIKPYLNENSLIAFEHGYMQKDIIRGFVEKHLPEAIIIQKKV